MADVLAGQAEDLAAPAADAIIDGVPAADLAQAPAQALAMAELLGRSEISGAEA